VLDTRTLMQGSFDAMFATDSDSADIIFQDGMFIQFPPESMKEQ